MLRPITRHALKAPKPLRFPQARTLTIATASPTFSAAPEDAPTNICTTIMADVKQQAKEFAMIQQDLAKFKATQQAADAACKAQLQKQVTELTSELAQLKRFQAKHESGLNDLGFVRSHMMKVKAEQEREAAEKQMEEEENEKRWNKRANRFEGGLFSVLVIGVGWLLCDSASRAEQRQKAKQADEGAGSKVAQ